LAFQGGGPVNPTAISGADGRYRLGPVPLGRYGKLGVVRGGYDGHLRAVTVTRAGAHADFAVRRNWAARSGGAAISAFTGPDFSSFGCGPEQAIDDSLVAGWGSTTGDDNGDPTGTFTPKWLVISLPDAVDVLSYAVDPSATCGDDETSSLGAYTLQTSTDGTTWIPSASGSFDAADDGRLNTVTPVGGRTDVRYVRLTMRGNQTPGFAATCPGSSVSGCSFTDMTEIKVYGVQH
jgi:extracellular elastinolytic metalloproteinase